MRRLLRASRQKRGFTLVEMLTATTVSAIVMVSICGIYAAISDNFERQQGDADTMLAVTRACDRLADYISQATDVSVFTRYTTDDTLGLLLPSNKVHGIYAPQWINNKLQYQGTDWVAFYLSDTTGSESVPGNILWAATVNPYSNPWVITPDRTWSMYTNSTGKVAPIDSIRFSVDNSGDRPKITITVKASYTAGKTTKHVTRVRTVTMRNAN